MIAARLELRTRSGAQVPTFDMAAARRFTRILCVLCALAEPVAAATGEASEANSRTPRFLEQPHLLPDWGGHRARLEEEGVLFEFVYTGDFLANTCGGIARKSETLGNLDLTFTWKSEELLDRDLGTFFLYGIVDHGGRPSENVGDSQGIDNIETRDAAKLLEAWWQKSLFDHRASLLVGLYDLNSEFYTVDSAEMFLHSSFGLGGELGTTGINGPSSFPSTSLGARFRSEPVDDIEVQFALLDGVPDDPKHPQRTAIRFGKDDGIFFIAEIAYHRSAAEGEGDGEDSAARPTQRRRVGRQWATVPDFVRIALGTWLYSAKQPHVSRTDAAGNPIDARGHPGLYLIADMDLTKLDPLGAASFSLFAQLGWADGDVGQFEGYTAGGFKYTGLLPLRRSDDLGFAVAAAWNGDAFFEASRAAGDAPAVAEVAYELTYRAVLTPWLSLQGDLQYVMNPGGLRSRPDALVAGFRYVVDF